MSGKRTIDDAIEFINIAKNAHDENKYQLKMGGGYPSVDNARLQDIPSLIRQAINSRRRWAYGYDLSNWEVREGVFYNLYFKFPIDFDASIKILLKKDKVYYREDLHDYIMDYKIDPWDVSGVSIIHDNIITDFSPNFKSGSAGTMRTFAYKEFPKNLWRELYVGENSSKMTCTNRAEGIVEKGNMWIAIE